MTTRTPHEEIEARFRRLLDDAGLPAPDEVGHLRRAVIFLWYDSKAIVLVDLDELPDEADPLEGLDVDRLAEDITGGPLEWDLPLGRGGMLPPGFAQTG
jgi:hypothetical protein